MTFNVVNIPLVKVAMPPKQILMPALERVLYSGMVAEGEYVYAFEKSFSDIFGLDNVVATSSGTAALHIAFLLAGIKSGDEVITTSMTAEPTNTTILQVGGLPVFADVDSDTGNLSASSVESLITSKTKAICVVHYAGYPADIKALRVVADKYQLQLIEDCAHALGATVNGVPIGTFGDFAIFSFQSIKHMTTIDGGILALKDRTKLDEAKRLRWFGLTKGVPRTEIDIKVAGYKYNMNNVTAAIGLVQLENIKNLLRKHRENGLYFDAAFKRIGGLQSASVLPGAESTYWLYTLLSNQSDLIEAKLNNAGIAASKLHRPNHLHTVFQPYKKDLRNLEVFYKRLTHIPCGWWVNEEAREKIVDILGRG